MKSTKSDFQKTKEHNTLYEEVPTLLSIRQFALKHPFMSENSLRWLLFCDPPGLEECIVRISSRRLFIDEDKFFSFLRNRDSSKPLRTKTKA